MKAQVKRVVQGYETEDGAGVRLVRVLGVDTIKDFDPFLMLDSFDSENPVDYIAGFPTHPHRGIETITYLSQGQMQHEDSLGNKGLILDGDVQWMTAGSGILHSEFPQPSDRMLGLQFWLNLPRTEKMTNPKYFDIKNDDIKKYDGDGFNARVISGEFKGVKGAVPHHIKAKFVELNIKDEKSVDIELEKDQTHFLFTLEGFVQIDGNNYDEKSAILLGQGDTVTVKAIEGDLKLLFIEAPRLDEEVAWGGPIVMNTREELNEAFQELQDDTFIKEQAGGTL